MTISAGIYSALSDYLTQTEALLRDANNSLYTQADLTSFINRAMRQRDLDLRLNRLKVTFTLVTNTYDYKFTDIVASGTVVDGNANVNLMDLISIIVIPLGSATSAVRYPLARWPYSRLAPILSTSYPTYPTAYAMYGPTNVILGPPPAGNYPSEWDFRTYSPDLVNSTDQDPMPYPYTDPVPFLAAYFAKIQAQRFDEAQALMQTYKDRLAFVRGGSRSQMVQNPWGDFQVR